MIQITRNLARQLRAVFRKLTPRSTSSQSPLITIEAGPTGWAARLTQGDASAEYRMSGSFPPDCLALPLSALADIEGRDESPVTLEADSASSVVARWDDAGLPRTSSYEPRPAGDLPKFPDIPKEWASNPPAFLEAFQVAAETVAAENYRYAVTNVLLRGGTGELVATDGRQLFVESGFNFPWEGDALVAPTKALCSRLLASQGPVEIGRSGGHVAIRVGLWTIALPIETTGRFPKFEAIVPHSGKETTTLTIDAQDADYLRRALPRLPADDSGDLPITLDLNGKAAIRAAGEKGATEVVLARSTVSGKPVTLCTGRTNLGRALDLGFRQVYIAKPEEPVWCRADGRTYVWMPLTHAPTKSANGAPNNAASTAPNAESQTNSQPDTLNSERSSSMATSTSSTNGTPAGATPLEASAKTDSGSQTATDITQEALALKEAARFLFARASRLVTAVRKHKRQSQLLRTTLASLRELQQVSG